jgi:uncharacterized membrane protein
MNILGISRINSPKGMASLSKQLAEDITVKQDWKVLKLEKTDISSTASPLVNFILVIVIVIVFVFVFDFVIIFVFVFIISGFFLFIC